MNHEDGTRSNQPEEENLDALTAGGEENNEEAADDKGQPEDAEAPVINMEELRASIPHDDSTMLDSLVAFLRPYLVCDDHQLTILALWIVHTWAFRDVGDTAAYLDIRSPEPESGKTRCMELLRLLSGEPWFASGPSPRTVMEKLIEDREMEQIDEQEGRVSYPYAVLIDDCHHIFGRTDRKQQLLAMLNSGSRRTSTYMLGDTEYCVFRPMAFAGNDSLPRSLAARCIPIVLRRKKPSDSVEPYLAGLARYDAREILRWLDIIGMWSTWLDDLMDQNPPSLPENWALTAHQEDCAEPLLCIAEKIGGHWPERARAALVACFSLAEYTPTIQVLADVRASFRINNDPEYLLSRDLLPLLGAMDSRPWAGWNSGSGRKLGNLLRPFGISSRNCQPEGEKNIKGYHLRDFQDAWERYLQPLPILEPPAEGDALNGNSVSAQGGA